MYLKNISLRAWIIGLLCVGITVGLVAITTVRASVPEYQIDALRKISIGSFSLARGDSHRVHIFDMGTATSSEVFRLPSYVGKHGQIYTVKMINEAGGGIGLQVFAQDGETIDQGEGGPNIELYSSGAAATFVADDINNTWWLINQTNFQ